MTNIYVDEACKLNIRSLVSAALKADGEEGELFTRTTPLWVERDRSWAERPDNHLTAKVTLKPPTDSAPTEPISGEALLTFVQADGRKCEQMLSLTGVPIGRRQRRWRARCPLTGKLVQTLYLSPVGQQFMSREAAELTYRPYSRAKVGRHIDRIEAIKRELCTDLVPGVGIFKPPWMTDARYNELTQELVREDVRRMCAMTGRGEPDFGDMDVSAEVMDPAGEWNASSNPEPMQVNDPQSMSMYYRDKAGTLQMRANYKKKYGLPDGA
jgi:hypothetical protein